MAITKIDDMKSSKAAQIKREVFVVHGHNSQLRDAVALFLTRLGLEPIILHEQVNAGATIIEKLEKHSRRAGYAIILLTADDIGCSKAESSTAVRPRARQNVIMELGLFIGLLGRERVSIIHDEGIELPSDINGLLYTAHYPAGHWRISIAKEIKSGGLSVDLNRL